MFTVIPFVFVGALWALALWALQDRGATSKLVSHFTSTDDAAYPLPKASAQLTSAPRRERFCILHNADAGRNDLPYAHRVADALRANGATVDVFGLQDILFPPNVSQSAYDAIVISGGDGTIRSLAATLPRNVPLGIIPNGTGNVMAAELGIPRGPQEIANLLMQGATRRIQSATANGQPFLLMFGAGFDGEVVRNVSRDALKRMGKFGYAVAVARVALRKPQLFEVEIDGVKSRASWIVVTNAGHYGGNFLLTRMTDIQRSGLVAVVSRARTRRQRVWELVRLSVGRMEASNTIDVTKMERARILTSAIPAQIDGDAIGESPFVISRDGFETSIIAPAG